MKKLFFLLALFFLTLGVQAQGPIHSYTLGAAPSKYTPTHTVSNTGVDTFEATSASWHNSVGFQHVVTKQSGNPALSYVITWGSKDTSQFAPYYQIAVDTVRNVSGAQVFSHDMGPCGVGNPARWYMTTYQGAGTASCTFSSILFIR